MFLHGLSCRCCHPFVLVLALAVGLRSRWNDCMLSSHRRPGGVGEAEGLSGWDLHIRVLPQHSGEVQCCHHLGGTPHSEEVSLGFSPGQAHGLLLCSLQKENEICFVESFFFSPLRVAYRHLACSQKQRRVAVVSAALL